ncbi:MAG: galactose mutarotase, partial [Clostridiales Family XIII bacterium]|nr:galactose mutarotase [Clostridiales Family XIII bacterium]
MPRSFHPAGRRRQQTIAARSIGGFAIKQYVLKNSSGMEVHVTDYGATVTKILVPDRSGRIVNAVLGYDDLSAYVAGDCFFGATIGRIANRVADGRFSLNGKIVEMDKNDGGKHALHGGFRGYDKREWEMAEVSKSGDGGFVRLALHSPDGDQGLPGSADIEVKISLDGGGAVRFDYLASADKDTAFNLTNHSYFNLSGAESGNLDGQWLSLDADAYTPVDGELIPTGEILPVAGTRFDFRKPKPLTDDF